MRDYPEYGLRDLEESDLLKVWEWRNSDRIRQHMYTDHFISWQEHLNWYNRIKNDPTYIYKIFEFQKRPVGVVNFSNIDKRNKRCYWGFYLGETNLPKGLGTVLGYYGLTYAFQALQVMKICSEVLESNTVSVKYHLKLGFVQEGHFIKHIFKNGTFEDVLAFACFEDAWQEIKHSLEDDVSRFTNTI